MPVIDLFRRMLDAELRPPLRLSEAQADTILRIPAGRLPSVCLTPTAIHREKTIVTAVQFSSGVVLRVADVVALQDAGALIVAGYQLIHPRDYSPYYRAKADNTIENNLESLPAL